MIRHILVNSASPIIVQSSLNLGTAILRVAALSFLGLGAQPPSPEWGGCSATAGT
jgi:ABC-type dipeptide/oligopeptide/nickel transport system permease subunit